MTAQAYVLIRAGVGKAAPVPEQVPSINDLGLLVVRDIRQIEDIARTITCPVIRI